MTVLLNDANHTVLNGGEQRARVNPQFATVTRIFLDQTGRIRAAPR